MRFVTPARRCATGCITSQTRAHSNTTTIRSYHINTSLSLLIGPLALSFVKVDQGVFHLKASSKHPGQFQYFISKLLQNIQDNFSISSQSFFKTSRTISEDLLILWLLFHLKASSQYSGHFQSFPLTTSFQYPRHFQLSRFFTHCRLGTSDILQDSWSSSNAIQQAFYKGFTFLLIGSLHSNGFTF
ncbi:hypothetical protein BU17DRAFT_61795 [Hysterangium stoloniferum]|nr:hypothetical protein BU17DRAFT_61795 [Hysterangium stoloniferum]